MKVSELAEKLGLKSTNDLYDKEVHGVFISDMVSDIVAGTQPGNLLITIQTHKNLIAAANLVDVSAVVFVRGKTPQEGVIQLADRAQISLFTTDLSAWELAIKLHDLGIE